MITLKCKMCGGTIEVSNDQTIGTCEYCGSTMTLPRIESEKKARLFNRANDYRINCEFDKAYDAYRMIVDEDEQEAEAYWGMLLSEYGVEYVEDPKTKKRIPTCHRTHMKSIKSQTNYELACKYADTENKMMYQDEADILNRIQKSILSISTKEEPYDVFICYKETDPITGDRTIDSVVAQEIYDKLTEQGIRVFFSRITLEDKLGKDYEPYIFSALTSAKVMLVVASTNENVESTWVKNEWSRYLHFMSEDKNKVIIPVYKDMQICELPDELNKFQGQDMNKVGAIQDLCRSVKKLVKEEKTTNNNEIIDAIKKDIEKDNKKKSRRRGLVVAAILLALIAVGFIGYKFIYLKSNYYMNQQMINYISTKDYYNAMEVSAKLDGYGNSKEVWLEAVNNMLIGKWYKEGANGKVIFIYGDEEPITAPKTVIPDYDNKYVKIRLLNENFRFIDKKGYLSDPKTIKLYNEKGDLEMTLHKRQ